MKQILDHRISVNLSRKKFCRKDITKLDIHMKTDPRTKDYYTGLNGRFMCFQFNDAETKRIFAKMFNELFNQTD